MAFQRPALPEIIDRTFSDLTSRLTLKGAILRRSVVGVLARIIAGASHMLHGHLDHIAKEAIPDTAVDNLSRWAAIWGVTQKPAEFASGPYTFAGVVNGSVVPAGATLKRSDGVEYVTLADATIAAGVATVTIQSLDAGALGNADAGTSLSLVYPVAGVNGDGTVAAGGLVNGSDIESDDSLRARLLARIQQPPHGGNAADYKQWALEVPGVTRAWVYPLYLGVGSVGVTFVRDADASIIPDGAEVAAVQEYIDARRPVTATVTVFAPVADAVNFTIQGVFNAATKAAITAELADFIEREAEPGGTLYLSRINEAISIAEGESDHELVAPAANVVRAAGHISTMGVVTWA